ncbi:potassium ion transporter [Grosmannia clavigera kw1407]|uniref:Potassium transport protein n=1 Tax=Grosmannia clavigera (strain kw1407 / UAMH 11150) TaxID=655863 RepID=F0XUE6_GROCL|nr:potassium ion transporter [Grosmannia clavigera kw1407]EFW98663.1 potassium ion transporter [Grosmannia clavigera kw1407]
MDSLRDIVLQELKSLRPSFLSKNPHFNFISVHYFWIVGLTVIGSILLYGPGRGKLKYIDALTFAAGGSTQAGLNTVDVNTLDTFQQVVLYVICSLANPITINSFVVFLRLYWFEKRFQHIVHDTRLRRGTISKSKAKAVDDLYLAERGVNGRHITVLHNDLNSRIANDGAFLSPVPSVNTEENAARLAENGGAEDDGNHPHHRPRSDDAHARMSITEQFELRRPEIKFATTVKRSDGLGDQDVKVSQRVSDEEHIAILERQRNLEDDEVLCIPGPRDAERGVLPSRVVRRNSNERDETNPHGGSATREHSPNSVRSSPLPETVVNPSVSTAGEDHATEVAVSDGTGGGHPIMKPAITIQEPEKPPLRDDFTEDARAFVNVFTSFRARVNPFVKKKKGAGKDKNHNAFPFRFTRRPTLHSLRQALTRDKDEDTAPYLSWQPTVGRNSAFIGMSDEQREELGGIEYRSLKTLALVLFVYFWGFWLLGTVCLIPWIMLSKRYGAVVDAADQGRVWWGFFTAQSSFMDLGFTLTPDSMNSFNTAVFPLLLMSFLIVIGNTGFPVMLRLMIWVGSILVPRGSGLYEELTFLLDHPRRCFTLLFPSGATWWLFWLLVILNGIDLLFYCVLDLGSGPIAEMSAGSRVLDGLFQAFSTRTAGFSCVNLATLHPAVQASYMIMMYISVFPIAISVRRTNVYEENSLGIYVESDELDESANGNDLEFVGAHLRRQLSFDLWFLSVGFFILTISEGTRLQKNDFSMFAILFEVISAYGTVGLSLGYPTVNASLCSQFSVIGKLVIIAMMIRGRHRGLPYGLDRAILLPSESLNQKEDALTDGRNAPCVMTAAGRRGSVTSMGTQAATLRVTTSNRDRGRSRSRDHGNGHIFAQFLHPGPPIKHGPVVRPHSRRSFSDSAMEESTAQTTGIEVPGQDGRAQP